MLLLEILTRAIYEAHGDVWPTLAGRDDTLSCRIARTEAQAVITALHDAGMVVVPREPTEAMLNVDVGRTYHADEPGRLQNTRRDIYRAMITAGEEKT